jgi:hypothetical protein
MRVRHEDGLAGAVIGMAGLPDLALIYRNITRPLSAILNYNPA